MRYRDCAGSLTCPNLDCGFYVEFRKQNRVNFDKNGVCNFCAATGLFEECHARKYTYTAMVYVTFVLYSKSDAVEQLF